MEIVKKAVVSVNEKFEEVESVIDTGAERTMIDEEVLLRIGAPHLTNVPIRAAGEYRDVKPLYAVAVEIDGCKFGLVVTGGKKNLIGHDFFQLAKAVIDETNGSIKFQKSFIEM